MTDKFVTILKERRKALLSVAILLVLTVCAAIFAYNKMSGGPLNGFAVLEKNDPEYGKRDGSKDKSETNITYDSFANKNTSNKACKSLKKGVDVSVYQGNIDWNKAKKAGVQFAIIRVGYRAKTAAGTIGADKNFKKNIQGAIDANIPVGVYIFSQATTQPEAVEEANYVLEKIAGYKISLPVVIDYEYASGNTGRLYDAHLSKENATAVCDAFCNRVESVGYTGMVYANASMLKNQLNAESLAKKHRIWLANYVNKTSYSGTYDFWQCSSTGKASTYGMSSTYVDLDFWFDDGEKVRKDYSLVFDAEFYANKYKDLRDAFGHNYVALLQHFIDNGMSEGRQACLGFDPQFYRNQYYDLLSTYGLDWKKYYEHFINCGLNEGRQGSAQFSVKSYKNANVDLRNAFGNDYEKYYRHYMSNGQYESSRANTLTGYDNTVVGSVTMYKGVDYSKVFDFGYYKEHNATIKSKYPSDDVSALQYFVETGMKNGDQACESFSVKSYKNANPDLRKAYGNDWKSYYSHYMQIGFNENRVTTGYEDKIKDPTTVYNNKDYKLVYDFNYYVQHNPDVLNAFGYDEDKVIRHFVENGMSEGRQAIETFNVKSYKNTYVDLRNAFGDDYKKYFNHYMTNGYKEGRVATGNEDVVIGFPTKFNGVDYSLVYDYNYYVKNNPDVANAFKGNDAKVLEHFVNNGMSEARQACKDFNVVSYKNRYSDLRRAFGNDYKKYFMHYINNGKAEERLTTGFETQVIDPLTTLDGVDYSPVYDYNYYIKNNPDVFNAFKYDDEATLRHFINNGMNEGRKGNETFNVSEYKDQHPELYVKCGNVLKNYYMEYLKSFK